MMDDPLYLWSPAAGFGKRMKAVNAEIPKEMLPVGNKPAILYAVEEGLSAGINNIIIVINRQKEMIRKYFEDRKFMAKRGCSIPFLYQSEPLGESDAISNSGRGDLSLLDDDIFHVKKFYPKGDGHFIKRFRGELRTCGITISGPHIFEYIKRLRGSIKEGEFTDVPVRSLMLEEKGFIGFHLPWKCFGIGNPVGYEFCLSYIKKGHFMAM